MCNGRTTPGLKPPIRPLLFGFDEQPRLQAAVGVGALAAGKVRGGRAKYPTEGTMNDTDTTDSATPPDPAKAAWEALKWGAIKAGCTSIAASLEWLESREAIPLRVAAGLHDCSAEWALEELTGTIA
jgi:hypothetical protein